MSTAAPGPLNETPARPRWGDALPTAGTVASSALTHAPENAAYGLMALAPLGAAFGPVAMGLALLGAAVGSATASLVGAGRLAGDAGAALALLTTGLVAALVPLVPGSGAAAAWSVLLLVALGIAAGGVLAALSGLLRIGAVVKFTPWPVRAGLSTGVGLLLWSGAIPAAIGHGFGGAPGQPPLVGATLVGLAALAITAVATLRRSRVPPVLLGLVGATALQAALAWQGSVGSLGPTVGVPALPTAWFGGGTVLRDTLALLADPRVLSLLGGFALTVAVVVVLDTLLAASVVDGRLRGTRNANRELVAQGLANVASATVGGLPFSAAMPVSLGLATARPAQRHIVLAYAAALAAILFGAPALLGLLPVSAVGGVLVFLGAAMISPTLWRLPADLLRQRPWRAQASRRDARRWRHLAADWLVTLAVALCALGFGLGPAVLVGATFAVLLFVRSNIRDVVRRAWSGATRHSMKTRPTAVAEVLRREGGRIALLELEGPLFFGTADALRARLQRLSAQVDTAILDLHQIGEVDVTAARILVEMAEDWERAGRPLVFAEWAPDDPRRELLESVAEADRSAPLRFEDTSDHALEMAEERLLARLPVERHDGACLALADTMIARGLSPDELALLRAEMASHDFARGQVIFRAGDPGDALYISLRGEIGLRVPGSRRRLASFAPGVTIGEMAVLARAARSAEAVAESDVAALSIPVEAFERLMQTQPALAAKLMGNIALHLADRVRMLTGDLAGWVSRSAATRTAGGPAPEAPR